MRQRKILAMFAAALLLALTVKPASSAPALMEDCVQAPDPPSCAATVALQHGDDVTQPLDLVRTAVESGAPALVTQERARLVAAAQEKKRAKAEIEQYDFGRDTPARNHLRGAYPSTVAAAIALAAAAQIADDPFAQEDAKALIAAAGGRSTIAPLAATIWTELVRNGDWRVALTRPRGLAAIWKAVIAQPPRDTAMTVQLMSNAAMSGYPVEALTLARLVAGRRDLSEHDRLTVDMLINDAPQRGRPREYDATIMKSLLEICFDYISCRDELQVAGDAGAVDDLKATGAEILARARASELPLQKTNRFGLASEAYRLAGDIETALVVAREGMPAVEAALRAAGVDGTSTPTGRYLALLSDPDGIVAPAIALYRAGAREEALKSGFMSGYQRFHNAKAAGEAPDAKWVVDDRVPFEVDDFVDELVEASDTRTAARLHDTLSCGGPGFYEEFERDELERELAITAALAGRRTTMNAHLAAAAHLVNVALATGWSSDLTAGPLAGDWRRALTIAERVEAKEDETVPLACAPNGGILASDNLDGQAQ